MLAPRPSDCPDLTTEDNRTPIELGSILYNYYDGEWGKVLRLSNNGWFYLGDTDAEIGSYGGTLLNGVRVSSRRPIYTNGRLTGYATYEADTKGN